MSIIETAKSLQTHLAVLRREFHQHPEPSMYEEWTSQRILRELEEIGGYQISKHLGSGGHGILAEISGEKPGKTIVLRADMDALQITEETDAPFQSLNPGKMHACGHDNHITALLGAAQILVQHRDKLEGTVRLIFQPAEELSPVGGARSMIDAGALDGADAVFGMHVWPNLPLGVVGIKPGPAMAASDHFTIHITGKPSHAGRPQDGCDAVVAGANFVTAAQTIVSRNVDPMESVVITIGQLHAGTRYNILSGECEIQGTCRTYSPEVRDLVERRLQGVLDGVCTMYNCTGTLEYCRGYAALINDPKMTEYAAQTVADLFGSDHLAHMDTPTMLAEDFSFYLLEKPGSFVWFGTGDDGGGSWPLHNCHFNPDEDILWRAAALMTGLALNRGEIL